MVEVNAPAGWLPDMNSPTTRATLSTTAKVRMPGRHDCGRTADTGGSFHGGAGGSASPLSIRSAQVRGIVDPTYFPLRGDEGLCRYGSVVTDRGSRELDAGGQAELREHVGEVGLDGPP